MSSAPNALLANYATTSSKTMKEMSHSKNHYRLFKINNAPLILLSALECSCDDCCCMAMESPMMGPGGRNCRLLSPVAIARIPSAIASSAACCLFSATCR